MRTPDFHRKGSSPLLGTLGAVQIFLIVRITEVPIFLIVFDLLFQMQEKSRRSIDKKGLIKKFVQLLGGGAPFSFSQLSMEIRIQLIFKEIRPLKLRNQVRFRLQTMILAKNFRANCSNVKLELF